MWQRFSEEARNAIFYAQEEAQKRERCLVDTEHILLGLLRNRESVACRALESVGVSPDSVVTEVEKALIGQSVKVGEFTLSPRAKRVLDLAYASARELNHNQVGAEHLLAGLVREESGAAGNALAACGIKYDALLQAIRGLSSE